MPKFSWITISLISWNGVCFQRFCIEVSVNRRQVISRLRNDLKERWRSWYFRLPKATFKQRMGERENGKRATGNGQRATENEERRTGDGERATENGQRATGSGKMKNGRTGNGQRGAGNEEREMRNGQRATGNEERAMRNGEWGMGNEEWGMRNGEWGTGNEEWGMGNGELLKWGIFRSWKL